MASSANLLLSSVRIPATQSLASLMASTNQTLLSMNTQMQQISSAFTLTKPTTTVDGTTGGITVGNIIMGSTNFIRGGATGYNTGTGFWLGYDTSPTAGYKFFVGAASGNKMTWDGSTLAVTGTITATTGTIGGWTIGPTTISSGGLYLDSTQKSIRSGQTNYDTGTGYWLGNVSGTAKLSIGSTTNYFKWDGSNLAVQGGSGSNLVIIDTNGFTVGKAADRRVVMGTYGGNPASLNFFATTNPTTSRLGIYLNGGTAPSIDLAYPSGAYFGVNANGTDFALSGGTPIGTYRGSFTFNTALFETPVFDLNGPAGSLTAAGPRFTITNTTDYVKAVLQGGLVRLDANDGVGNTGAAFLGVDATGGGFFTVSTTYSGVTKSFAYSSILSYPVVDLTGPNDPKFQINNSSSSLSAVLKSTSLVLGDVNIYRSAADNLKTDDLFLPSAGVQASNGLVSAPSYSFAGDTNTGLYWRSADNVGITCGGSDILVVRSNAVVCLQPLKLDNTFQANTGLTVAGYVTIQDSGGTTYKVMLAT
jgi:hypothetical protein